MVKVIDWNNRITGYEYDGNGRLVKTKRPNGTELTLIYDAAGQVVQRKEVDAEGNIIFQYDYVYDSAGNVIEENSDQEPLLHNLTGAVMEYGTGNILASYNGQQVEYDADGNMTYGPLNGQMAQYVFDARNRLISAGNTSYEYDAQNNRTAVIEDGNRTEYVINPNALLSQVLIRTDADGKQTFYIYGLGLIAQEDSEGNYSTYHYDSRGSTVAITDINGEVTDTFEYAPYGELVSRTGTTDTPFLFNGREGVMTDSNGLYYMRARYYNPEIKRFINQDVVQGAIENGLSLNRYAYSNGNPISYIDPFGLSPLDSEKIGSGFNPIRKAWNSIKEIGQDIYGGFVTRADNAFTSLGGFVDYITLGIPSGIYSGLKSRSDIMLKDPSLYNIANLLTMGLVSTIEGAVVPSDPLSKEHWLDSFSLALTVVGGYKSIKTSMAKDGSLLTGGPSESFIRKVEKDALYRVTSKTFEDYALDATKNANSNKVILGKYMQNNVSYIDVATKQKATYFQIDEWDEVASTIGNDNMWNINKEFLNQQWKAGKDFYFSHNPWEATGYFQQEVLHLIDLGVKDFIQVGNNLWKAVK